MLVGLFLGTDRTGLSATEITHLCARSASPLLFGRHRVCLVAAHFAALVPGSVQRLHHFACLTLGNLEERNGVLQFDMSHGNTAAHIAVDELHGLARIETVFLSQVNEQTLIAFLGFARPVLGRLLSPALGSTLLLILL